MRPPGSGLLARRTLPALALAACAGAPPPQAPGGAAPPGRPVWVLAGDWHTELALPAGRLGPLGFLRAVLPGAWGHAIGFGKRDFFMAEPPGLAEWLAAPLPGPAVLRATALPGPPAPGAGREAVALGLGEAGEAGLLGFVAEAFLRDAGGQPLPPVAPPARGRAFFAARDAYTLAWNCNRWTAEALAAAGLAVAPAGVLLPADVMRQARRLAQAAHG